MGKKLWREAFLDTLPDMAGYLVLGMGFGILLDSIGYGPLWAFGMSVFVYAGSMQYLAVELLASGASVLTAAISTLLVNGRHLFYGISMLQRYRGAGAVKPYLIWSLTDETYSLLGVGEQKSRGYYLAVSLLNHCYWIVGCTAGSLLGAILPFSTEGVDFALTALFVTVFIDQWKTAKNHTAALTGLFAATLALFVFGKDAFMIPAMVLMAAALYLQSGKGEKQE